MQLNKAEKNLLTRLLKKMSVEAQVIEDSIPNPETIKAMDDFGIFTGGLGLLLILEPFIFSYFGLKSYVQFAKPITILSVIIFMFIFGSIKKDRINKPGIDKEKNN